LLGISVSPDDLYLAVGCKDGTILIIDPYSLETNLKIKNNK
jgi:hypothetical protein